jgi:tripartite-type tricarboxylate transporter receptor subunit TctC
MGVAIGRRSAIAIAAMAAASLTVPAVVRLGRAEPPRAGSRTGRIIVPFAAGGTTDLVARVVGEILSRASGIAFAIENRTGGGGNICAEIVAKAVPDGRTLLLGHTGIATTNQYLYKYLAYDSVESFAPVAMVGEVANVLVVHRDYPCRSFTEFVARLRSAPPSRERFASPAIGSIGHLSMECLQGLLGVKLTHMAYRGRSRMIRDLLAGHVQIAMDNLPAYLPHIRSGALRALAVTSAERWFNAPDIPTVGEQGFGDYAATLWWYVAAPAGTRLSTVRHYSDALIESLGSELMIGRMKSAGALPTPRCAEDLAEHIAGESNRWGRVIRAAGIEAR